MADEEYMLVPMKEYRQLLADSEFLAALEAAGVDNWQGIDYAYRILEGEEYY